MTTTIITIRLPGGSTIAVRADGVRRLRMRVRPGLEADVPATRRDGWQVQLDRFADLATKIDVPQRS